jgi:hypothetical protein
MGKLFKNVIQDDETNLCVSVICFPVLSMQEELIDFLAT